MLVVTNTSTAFISLNNIIAVTPDDDCKLVLSTKVITFLYGWNRCAMLKSCDVEHNFIMAYSTNSEKRYRGGKRCVTGGPSLVTKLRQY